MMISTDKLKNKEVINIADGRSLGFVYDIEVDLERGAIDGILIPAQKGFMGFFSKGEDDVIIKWSKVKTVGDDVILVDLDGQ
jgi:YlmC/YmxH family sporulation protein